MVVNAQTRSSLAAQQEQAESCVPLKDATYLRPKVRATGSVMSMTVLVASSSAVTLCLRVVCCVLCTYACVCACGVQQADYAETMLQINPLAANSLDGDVAGANVAAGAELDALLGRAD